MEWSEELSGGLLQAAPDAIVVMDEGRIVLLNDRAEEIFGWPRDELLGKHADVLLTEAARDAFPEEAKRSGRGMGAGPMGTVSLRVLRRDGTEFPAEASLAVVSTAQGELTVAVVRDVTERRQLEAAAQGHRSQRLEALGQLAGGIAHDFNNLLGVIVNYAHFVIEEAESPSPDVATIAADARQVVKAGERGTGLTHQLLKFARREVIRPQVLDLNEVLREVEELLRRTLGEHIGLVTNPAATLPTVTCDPGQIEQLLVSLAVNARDAMPGGGSLVIDTAAAHLSPGEHPELTSGDYVRLRVCDSGRGMTPDVVERAFEPFFTTKPNHEAAGLGLATVYGIATQAGGSVGIASEPGVGTTVTVLLPASQGEAPEEPAEPEPAATLGHGETLLVVEDEAALRDVAGRILSGAGYHVLSADGGTRALEVAALHEGTIDLLVSDVVMPGMLGKELAERLTGVRPETRVLYMSGYAQPVLASQGTLDPGVALLEKPFTAEDLLAAVRKRLDS
ncbi:PAS domain S-box protein [Couchioplanes caeruleus]|uniref:hybrid sensor histidine kinase/response regulator n=1 Tax=Couchioplanes caeruleus TaxID=56438 RepID=UPI0020BD63AC|nr:PAS domain-containing hybrid sensor histidine kinase/response regulator [Couchioplanes caeruleus]UQU63573.1 PAS domain S-box protein [Couchioplanes caeruleus]